MKMLDKTIAKVGVRAEGVKVVAHETTVGALTGALFAGCGSLMVAGALPVLPIAIGGAVVCGLASTARVSHAIKQADEIIDHKHR